MVLSRFVLACAAALVIWIAGPLVADEENAASAEFRQLFESKVSAFLDNHCTHCHGGDEPEAGMPLDNFETLVNVNDNREVWLHVVEKLNGSEMPPEDEPQPAKAEKDEFLKIVSAELGRYDCTKNIKPGRVTVRRLNRADYDNTVRDLVGIDFQPAQDFPADDVGAGFDNIGDVLSLPPLLMEKYLDAAEQIVTRALESEEAKSRLITAYPSQQLPAPDAAKKSLTQFASRAFRRPLSEDEIARLEGLFQAASEAGFEYQEAVGFATQAVLVSPYFLFRIEFSDGEDVRQPRELNGYELAARLSYFLWSSMPDQQLFDLAGQNKLHEPEVLGAQVRRMLADDKADALVKNFAGQWLELRNLAKLNPAAEVYPEFDEELRAAMKLETEHFFRHVMKENLSVLEFIDSSQTFVNGRLARHYGIGGIEGNGFQLVSLSDGRRGGILTHASILTLTSNPTRTSPVKRGKWILDNILGEPPPPPPPGVEELAEGETELLGSLRERMQQHRDNPSCAVCHKKMDALGFGFENFDGIGKWRENDGRHEIDASGELPGKLAFNGPAELRKIIKTTKKDRFVKCLVQKMLTYALGRELTPDDRCTVDTIVADLEKADYRFADLVGLVASSKAFRVRGALGEN